MNFYKKILILISVLFFLSCTKNEAGLVQTAHKIKNNRLVFTYFFSWYDSYSGSHMNQLQNHPMNKVKPKSLEYSYRSKEWYVNELKDMKSAGIDALLFTFWGKAGCIEKYPLKEEKSYKGSYDDQWSYIGLDNLVEAVQEMESKGMNPPKIGMFLDTSLFKVHPTCRDIKQPIDLREENGKKLFYDTIKSFYKRVPENLWARMENKPVVFVYSSDYIKNHDKDLPGYIKTAFKNDFSKNEPYLVFDYSWKKLKSDNWFRWGAALHKPTFGGICQIGPGYDDNAVSERKKKHSRGRAGGKYYRESWEAVMGRCKHVAIETWNEFHEGSGIAATKEYGKKYIELTREYVDKFKLGK